MFISREYNYVKYLIILILILIIYLLLTQHIQITFPSTSESFQDIKFNYIDQTNTNTDDSITINIDNDKKLNLKEIENKYKNKYKNKNNPNLNNSKLNNSNLNNSNLNNPNLNNPNINLKNINRNLYLKYKQNVYTKLLQLTRDAMEELGIPCFLSSGTCLGYFRENKFIDHDYDIDIGIMVKDYTPQVIQKMEEKGFNHYRTLGDLETGMELSFRYPGTAIGKQAKVDIFLHYPEDENKFICWYSYKYPEFTEKIKYRVNNFDLKKVEFMGVPIYVPNPTLNYITQHYGEDWMVPRRAGFDYFYATSPKSIVRE